MIRLRPRIRVPQHGFTLIELVVTLTLVSVLALVAVPLYEVTATRARESELRTALRTIRSALDAYKYATDNGYISKGTVDSGYPPSLQLLVDGVDTVAAPVNGVGNVNGNAGVAMNGAPGMSGGQAGGVNFNTNGTSQNNSANSAGAIPSRMVFLRQVPRDPFYEDQSVAPNQQWNLRAYGSSPGDFGEGADVYDVSSKSTAVGLNGVPYKDW
jgi:general secretion pathway protein G